MRKNHKNTLAILALLGAAILWGFNTPLIKIGVEYIPASIFVTLRFVIAGLIVLPFACRVWRPLSRRDTSLLCLASIFNITLSAFILNIALKYTSAGNAAILSLLSPMILLLLSSKILRERINVKTIIGTLIALAGASVIISRSWTNAGIMGDMLVLVSIFCGVISIIITKSVALKIKTEQLTFMNLVPGTIPLIAYTVLVPQDWNIAAMPAKAWSALIFTIICVVGANLLFFYGLKQKPAHKTGIYTYIQVAVAILMAWLLLGEHPVPLFIVGVILIGSGVYIAQLHKTSQNRHRVSTEVHKEGEHNYTK